MHSLRMNYDSFETGWIWRECIVKRFGPGIATLAGIAFLIVSWEQPAYAYLDPGAGSLLLQVLMGGLAGAAVVVKVYWNSLMARFGRGDDTRRADPGESDT